ncbi:hypothetical protein AMATHDRAFT_84931 [Amanita thiersii Skay4041]|uniref:ZZ-type domain-containing protein n=1 Tax=Amanita thiersii Skay4041 TaxID=703135 RepID=A0A2A9NUB7_9AGAR|nr:hypothetical protein AMATHDRAFT_84931 [Amanita thiersii Skay4041]
MADPSLPDKPLIIRCAFNRKNKKISFHSARNCTYSLLRARVEQGFSLRGTPYIITYKDDDQEESPITNDVELAEAISYYNDGSDEPVSSGSSLFSGRSSSSRKITMIVEVNVEFDGRLSDTASLEDFYERKDSHLSPSWNSSPLELEDDSITVSSRDYITVPKMSGSKVRNNDMDPLSEGFSESSWLSTSNQDRPVGSSARNEQFSVTSKLKFRMHDTNPQRHGGREEYLTSSYEEDAAEDLQSINESPPIHNRHTAWLREQSLTNRANLGQMGKPYSNDASSQIESSISDISLEMDMRGKYYYAYTPTSSRDHDTNIADEQEAISRPSPMHLKWLASQQILSGNSYQDSSSRAYDEAELASDTHNNHTALHIDQDYERFIPHHSTSPPADTVTTCSHCGVLLETIRYICSTCGPKLPIRDVINGPGVANGSTSSGSGSSHSYPPTPQHAYLRSPSSSLTIVGGPDSQPDIAQQKPLPSLPSSNSDSSLATSTYQAGSERFIPYELCSECVQDIGVNHAIQPGIDPRSSPIARSFSSPSIRGLSDASEWHRSAPEKGKLRHAFREQVWTNNKWTDLQQDESSIRECSMCGNATDKKRYKCATCPKINMCQSCYSQVHDLHPMHAFIAVPDVRVSLSFRVNPPQEEEPMVHRGVECVHCFREIVGARYHCPYCDIDICQNCESAGLPGNLNGHDTTHIMLKIPYNLDARKVILEIQTPSWTNPSYKVKHLSGLARSLEPAADSMTIRHTNTSLLALSAASPDSVATGGGLSHPLDHSAEYHQTFCSHCRQLIVSVWYQCANCPSLPASFNLCQNCEERSYELHNPSHVFFRLPRPVDRPLESGTPFLPEIMYRAPAGPSRLLSIRYGPKDYLRELLHTSAMCDCCFEPILGEWFRCVYCPRDLCNTCLALDTHDDTHFFLVFKSVVDIQVFSQWYHIQAVPSYRQFKSQATYCSISCVSKVYL